MTIREKSDTELEFLLIEKTQKLLVTKAASGDFRIALEKSFASDISKVLGRLMVKIAASLRDAGYLELFKKQRRLLSLSYFKQRDLRREATSLVQGHLLELDDFVFDSSERRAFQRIHRQYIRMAYEYGGITSLRSLGFRARSRRLEAFERSTVSKALPPVVDAGVVFEFGLTEEEIIFWLEEGTLIAGAELGSVALRTARGTIIEGLFIANLGIDEIAARIAGSVGVLDWQALRIATTEIQVAFNSAMNDQYIRSGVKKRSWLTVGDRRVRASHTLNEGEGLVPYPHPFSNGAMHPGDGPDSVNCRCTIQADLSDPRILLQPWDGQPQIMAPGIAPTPRSPRRSFLPRRRTPIIIPPPVLPRALAPKPTSVKPEVSLPEGEIPKIGGKMPTTAAGINDEVQSIVEILAGPWGRDPAFSRKAKKRIANLKSKRKRITGVRPVRADVDDIAP
jgi:hypothetical protein